MMDDKKENPEIYSLRDPSTLTEMVIVPSGNSDIFAIKTETPILGVTLSEGVSLCGAYRLDKRLSRDEIGETWQASDLQASRNVIVYLPPLEKRTDAAAMEPVRQAARHVEALEHPRIVPFLDNLTDLEHGFFSVRKFVNGKTLDLFRKDYVKRHKQFARVKAMKMLSDVAHALDYAHSVGVTHGDLCPKSILVGLDDEVYLTNFSLLPAPTLEDTKRQSYVALEVKNGLGTTMLSDVYSLAVVAYELLSGRLPFSPETIEDVPLPIPGVPSTVDGVFRKALTRDPEDRYSSCGAFVKALETSFQESMKIKSAAMPSSKQRTSLTSRPLFWATLLGLLFAGVGIVWVQQRHTESLPDKHVAGRHVPEEVPTLQQRVESPSSTSGQPPVEPPLEQKIVPEDKMETFSKPAETVVLPLSAESADLPSDPKEETNAPVEKSESMKDETHELLGTNQPNVPVPVERPEPPFVEKAETEEQNPPQQNAKVLPSPLEAVPSVFPDDRWREEGESVNVPIEGVGYRFLWCKGKPFLMGTEGFWIQETPVTQELWKAVMGAGQLREQPRSGNRLPVVRISWKDCEQFLEKLNTSNVLSGEEFKGFRFSLPTERQWEHTVKIDENIMEWCSDWYDDAKQYRVVRGSGEGRNRRMPDGRYENVGFRLVLVRSP